MSKLDFYIVDVFAKGKYTGNPLAVVVNASSLSDEQMQQIAQEMNYSETTFILSEGSSSDGYDVRIFTPKEELPFAGHPTLGTAYVIQKMLVGEPVEKLVLNLKVGKIPVTWEKSEVEELLWMQQNPPTFMQTFSANVLADILNLRESDIESGFPIQEVSTGIPFILVPLKTKAALKQIKVSLDSYYKLIQTTQAKGILVFCPETESPENQLSVRMFADALGIPEDPATGSANGCLAGYLVKHSYFGNNEIRVRVEQGAEMNRPSLLFLNASQAAESIQVSVGGKVILVAKGELL